MSIPAPRQVNVYTLFGTVHGLPLSKVNNSDHLFTHLLVGAARVLKAIACPQKGVWHTQLLFKTALWPKQHVFRFIAFINEPTSSAAFMSVIYCFHGFSMAYLLCASWALKGFAVHGHAISPACNVHSDLQYEAG
jgi:hypothetical protein